MIDNEIKVGIFDNLFLLYVVLVGTAALWFEINETTPEAPSLIGVVIVATVLAIGDIRMIINRGIVGIQRLARHLWRMCFALLFAVISFAFQVKKNYPDLNQVLALIVPGALVFFTMVYWLVKVLYRK